MRWEESQKGTKGAKKGVKREQGEQKRAGQQCCRHLQNQFRFEARDFGVTGTQNIP